MTYSLEAEQAVITSVLLEVVGFDEIGLEPKHFGNSVHAEVWSVMAEISNAGTVCDFITLSDKLPERGRYLIELVEGGHSSGMAKDYAAIIIEKWQRRTAMSIAAPAMGDLHDGDLSEALRAFDGIADAIQSSKDESTVEMKEGLKRALKSIGDLSMGDGGLLGIPSGITALDEMTNGWQDSDLIVVGARPSMGKTIFLLNSMVEAAKKGPVVCFSMEMPAVTLHKRMIAAEGSVSFTKLMKGTLEGCEWDALTMATHRLELLKITIDERSSVTPSQIKAACRTIEKKLGKIAMIGVDYLQLMAGGGKFENRTTEIGHISRSLKYIAKLFSCPVMALAQLNRSLESRSNKRPVNSDLRDSGQIEQDADVILFIYRDVIYNPTTDEPEMAEIIVGKQRNGPIGTAYTRFNGDHQKFQNLYGGWNE